METKKCFKCGEVKELTEFYKHPGMADGRVGKCKECNKSDVRKNYVKNIDYYQAYDQIRNIKRKDYMRANLDKYCEANPERIAEAKRKWNLKNKEQRASNILLSNGIRSGKIIRGKCQICGCETVEGHHFDYTKPLDVIWLCAKHHAKVHWWLRWNRRYYNDTSN